MKTSSGLKSRWFLSVWLCAIPLVSAQDRNPDVAQGLAQLAARENVDSVNAVSSETAGEFFGAIVYATDSHRVEHRVEIVRVTHGKSALLYEMRGSWKVVQPVVGPDIIGFAFYQGNPDQWFGATKILLINGGKVRTVFDGGPVQIVDIDGDEVPELIEYQNPPNDGSPSLVTIYELSGERYKRLARVPFAKRFNYRSKKSAK